MHMQWMDATHGNAAAAQMLAKAAMEEAAAALSVRRISTMDDLRPTPDDGHGHTLDPRMVRVCVCMRAHRRAGARGHPFSKPRARKVMRRAFAEQCSAAGAGLRARTGPAARSGLKPPA